MTRIWHIKKKPARCKRPVSDTANLIGRSVMPKKSISREGKNNSCYRHGGCPRSGWTPEYRSFKAMWNRCTNLNCANYAEYQGRGIKVCERWRSFTNFLEDMGLRPTPKHTLERINNNGNYEPSNCRWATRQEQSQNRRNCRLFTLNGETMCIAEMARRAGMHHMTLKQRLVAGWTPEEATSIPPGGKRG
jgi:hypothetical protein